MQSKSLLQQILTCCVVFALNLQTWPMVPQVSIPKAESRPTLTGTPSGQTVTLLPNGKWLALGGEDGNKVSSAASISDPRTGAIVKLTAGLNIARAWHTATVIPNGKVLVLGGIDRDGRIVEQAELFDPSSLTFQSTTNSLIPRAHHAAVLLTDGQLLVAGGSDRDGNLLKTAEIFDSRSGKATTIEAQLPTGRRDDHATLLGDGTSLFWGGKDDQGNIIDYAELFDPALNRFVTTTVADDSNPDLNTPSLAASIPEDGAVDVPPDVLIGLRFSKCLRPETVTTRTVSFQGPSGLVPALVVPAESGRLVFVSPKTSLLPGTKYTLILKGATDAQGMALVYKIISFTTLKNTDQNGDSSTTGAGNDSAASALAPLQAPPGVTAVAGQTLQLDGTPLENVNFKIDDKAVRSDRTGRFLLANVPAGHHAMIIDGRTANRGTHTYGVFEVGIDLLEGGTTVLPYKVWMTELDIAHAVRVQFPTTQEVVIKNPTIPGLEFHIPPKTVITDIDGNMAREISITPIPLNRPPFPLPNVQVPIYFTIQPGGGYIQVNNPDGPKGARLFYPNSFHQAPGTKMDFWNYDPDTRGWFIYGQGRVSADGQNVVPDPGVVIYELTGAMVGGPGWGPQKGGPTGGGGGGGGDPVDLSTGLFVYNKTDLYLPDVIPISLTRTYRQGDTVSRAFGIGMTHPYDMFIVGNLNDFSYVELVLPDGSRVRFDRTSGNGWTNSTLQSVTAPGVFYGSVFTNKNGWTVTLRNGTALTFIQPGIFGPSKYQDVGLTSITDRNGNTVKIIRDSSSYVSRVLSPNGRWIQFTYDAAHRVTSAQDNLGRTVQYSYDSQGRLSQVTDANNGNWSYGWDPTKIDQMTSITDARQIQFLQNHYDVNGRVDRQTQADGTIFRFDYTLDANNNITQTQVTDPNGNRRVVTFPPPPPSADGTFISGGYMGNDTRILGPDRQVYIYQRDPSTNLLLSVTDPLNRKTTYTYDNLGNNTSITRLAGTPNAVTTSFSYESTFNQLSSFTDALQHSVTFGYDGKGNLNSVTDPLNNVWNFARDSSGRVVSATDPLGNSAQISYSGADLGSITGPSGATIARVTDGGGRLTGLLDPLGNATGFQYNSLNEITKRTDALGGITSVQYDPNGNVISLTDPRNTQNPSTYAYNNLDQLQSRVDPLGSSSTVVARDGNGNVTCATDRRGKISVLQYDGLDRLTFAGFGASSCAGGTYETTTTYTYDVAGRPTTISDSVTGTMTFVFDGLDRLVSLTTSQGSVSYQYDAAGRRVLMSVAGQPPVSYVYDDANRLLQIMQGNSTVSFVYDAVNRRKSLTLPNGVNVVYGYDNQSRLTSLTFQSGTSIVGNLTYSYDQVGRVSQVGGSYATTALPAPVGTTAYDAANRLTSWNGATPSYDPEGNLLSDGINSFVWDAKNRLATMTGSTSANFQYDPFGRRIGKTIGGVSAGFIYDGPNVVQELSGGTPSANLLSGGIDETFTRTSASVENFLSDRLGSTVALTDPADVNTNQYTYEPYGNVSASGAGTTNSFQYTGRENDGTGFHYYRARYYNPALGRFISEDPLGFGGGINVYAYAGDDPINNTDPSGLCSDPGGSGTRYCAEAYIPQSTAWIGPIFFGGDDRGPRPDGGTYRWHQDYGSNGSHCTPGTSTLFGIIGATAAIDYCETTVLPGRKGKKRFRFRAGAGDGFGFGGAPDARYDITVAETDDGTYATGFATDYPNVEVWQYSDNAAPKLVFGSQTPWGPFGGPISLLPPNPMVPIPPH